MYQQIYMVKSCLLIYWQEQLNYLSRHTNVDIQYCYIQNDIFVDPNIQHTKLTEDKVNYNLKALKYQI